VSLRPFRLGSLVSGLPESPASFGQSTCQLSAALAARAMAAVTKVLASGRPSRLLATAWSSC
jgi:hypothetical protein